MDSVISFNCMDTVGWVTWHALAAALMLRNAASRINICSCLKVMFISIYLWLVVMKLILPDDSPALPWLLLIF